MLHELRVENLLLIERAELRLGPGLNVLTGETGRGQDRARPRARPAAGRQAAAGDRAARARRRPTSRACSRCRPALRAELADRLPEDAEELVLARRVSAEGRTRAYLGGRSATAADLRELGGALLSFYGQHEHRKLTLASAQLEILDGFCGPAQAGAPRGVRGGVRARARAAEAALEELQARAGARDRELDLLCGSSRRSSARRPSEAEEAELAAERERLRHLEGAARRRRRRAGRARAAARTATAARRRCSAAAARRSRPSRGVDPALDALADRAQALAVEADDLAGELRRYGEGVDATPGRLDEVEERLALLDRLKRKHGGTIEAVLAHAASAARRRDELAGAEEALEDGRGAARGGARGARRARPRRCARRARGRRRGWPTRSRDRLAELAMEGATFEVALAPRDGARADAAPTRSSS